MEFSQAWKREADLWQTGWRERIFSSIDQKWDILIIGGGISGAGVLREAANAGLKTLLVEADDFGFGTSSRSSKLIHGGIRYIRNKQYQVSYESVKEREWMLREAEKLVTPLAFLQPVYKDNESSLRGLGLQILVYDLMAPKWWHRRYSASQLLEELPLFRSENMLYGYQYGDALMDDARVVLRVIREAVQAGGAAINYARVEDLLRQRDGTVSGVLLRDAAEPGGKTYEVQARVVINAAGPWSDEIRGHVRAPRRLRKLRGSHIFLPKDVFPTGGKAVHILHPKDLRTMFAFDWEGAVLVGTTDLDHDPRLEEQHAEPFASDEEIDYIVEAARFSFPNAGICRERILSTMAGLRPIINTGKARPSDESRAHIVWEEEGLLTITGGKFTIFRLMARDVLQHACSRLPGAPSFLTGKRFFNPLPVEIPSILAGSPYLPRLSGRLGDDLQDFASRLQVEELNSIGELPACWAELRWAAQSEGVVHLDDLLLRRVRIGLVLPGGGRDSMAKIRSIVQAELGWDDLRWEQELDRYIHIWQQGYSPEPGGKIKVPGKQTASQSAAIE